MAIDEANAFMGNFVHGMGDPLGASANVLKSLRPDGTWMIVEPFAHAKGTDFNRRTS